MATDELILTNLHLIHIKKSFWGGKKDQVTIPINQIKIFEGKPQVSVTKTNGMKRLEIYYNGGQAIFHLIILRILTSGLETLLN